MPPCPVELRPARIRAAAVADGDSDRERRAGERLARRRDADAGGRPRSHPFATGLDHPRWLYVLPNGDVLVAETNAPPNGPRTRKAYQGWVMKLVMKRAGAGVAERRPHHAAARRRRRRRRRDAHASSSRTCIRRSAWRSSATTSTSRTPTPCCASRTDRRDADRPSAGDARSSICRPGPINHHWTKNVIASRRRHASLRDRRLEQQRRARTASTPRRTARRSGRSTRDRAASRLRVGPAQSERHGVGAGNAARCGRSSTSATSSAAISCPTT